MRNIKKTQNCEGWPINKADYQGVQKPKNQSEKDKQAERVVHLRSLSFPKYVNMKICNLKGPVAK